MKETKILFCVVVVVTQLSAEYNEIKFLDFCFLLFFFYFFLVFMILKIQIFFLYIQIKFNLYVCVYASFLCF